MSEFLAGLLGGLVALTGAFGVQILSGQQRRTGRRVQVIATFLADAEQLLFPLLRKSNRCRTWCGPPTPHFELMADAFDRTKRSGHELTFLCPNELPRMITALLVDLEETVVQSSPLDTKDAEYDARIIRCTYAIEQAPRRAACAVRSLTGPV